MSLVEARPLRMAVVGRTGQVALALQERGAEHGIVIVPLGRPEVDLTEPASLRVLHATRPDVVVNAAAYTAVDKAESEPELAEAVNGAGASAVASVAAELGVPLIHLSTDYVFDGVRQAPYRETDPTNAIGAYGRSKLAGEEGVSRASPDHAILRTSWVYSPFGTNFVRTMLRLAASRSSISVVADQHGCPTNANDLADAIISVARNLVARPDASELRGIFHATGTAPCTWFTFAQAVFAQSERHGGPSAEVVPIATVDYQTPARRPANSRLDCSKLARVHGVVLPSWQASLGACVERLLKEARA